MRKMPTSFTPEQRERIAALRKSGLGIKAIGKQLGRCHITVKRSLIDMGLFSANAERYGSTLWAGRSAELKSDNDVWAEHERWWLSAYTLPWYYRNHEANKAQAAANARSRHARIKHTAEHKLHTAARNTVARIARMVGSRRKPRTRTHEFLGCDYTHARAHLEALFTAGMTWANHGSVWEIDHIKPLAAHDLTHEAQRMAACHYTNLQPLAKEHNRAKGARF